MQSKRGRGDNARGAESTKLGDDGSRHDGGGPESSRLATNNGAEARSVHTGPQADPSPSNGHRLPASPETGAAVTKLISLIRVSTREQGIKGASPEEQRERLDQYHIRNGYPIPVPVEDLDDPRTAPSVLFTAVESATERATSMRKVWKRALGLAQPGAVFVCTRLDRFSRSTLAGLSALKHLKANGSTIVSLTENIDTSTPVGEMIFTILMSTHQYEERVIAARTSGGRRHLRRKGNWTEGPVPLGFERGERPGGGAGPLVPRDDEDHIALEAFVRRDEDITCWKIARAFKEKYPGIRRWSNFFISNLLRSRVYIGQIRAEARTGEWIDAHPAIVPRDLFFRVQARLDAARSDKGRPPNPESYASWFLHGLMTCGVCASSIRSSRYRLSAKSKSRKPRRSEHTGWYVCYRRHCGGRKCEAEWPMLRNNEIHERAAAEITARLADLRNLWADPEISGSDQGPPRDFTTERKKLKEKLQRVADGYAEGTIGKVDARRLREDVEKELAKIDAEEKRQRTERAAIDPASAQRSLLGSLPSLRELWAEGTALERRRVTELLTEKIELFPNGNLTITWRDAIQVVKKLGFIGGGGLLQELTTHSGTGCQFGEQSDCLEIVRKSVASGLKGK